jgi:hypothetical protein
MTVGVKIALVVLLAFVEYSSGQCISRAPVTFSKNEQEQLCRLSSGELPASCARRAKSAHRLKTSYIIDLCAGASSMGPADCIVAAPGRLRGEIKVALCRGASSEMPALCFADAENVRGIDDESKAILCAGASNRGPAQCLIEAIHGGLGGLQVADAIKLCRLATSQAPAACAKSKALKKLSPVDKVIVLFCCELLFLLFLPVLLFLLSRSPSVRTRRQKSRQRLVSPPRPFSSH